MYAALMLPASSHFQCFVRPIRFQFIPPSGTRALVAVIVVALFASIGSGQEPVYVGAREPGTASEIYGQGVRETPWLSPAEEQAGFHLPPGFEIQLFASEPQIAKPLNMAWDARGRLWVTSSIEYPYPAAADRSISEGGAPRDTLKILEDTDGDGRADKSTTFAEGLNIPIGVLPVSQGAICFSIPNLWLLRDTDGDGHADERQKLLGPFDTSRDTHGMVNSLSRGADGWIYACHGFNNQSDVTATDGSRVQLTSGNTFRFREDGSRIEQFTQGQVNPFGMSRDEWGNWYTADCHSKPLTRLLPGACYPSFGRPHDGLGFAPSMMDHLHGSTAICGLSYYQAEHFPPAYRQLFYSGNVMTSRINCNALQWNGSTVTAHELADFLTSDDPWFRPVDIQLGPDGALYVADFYNKIIGHYEVPLEHPERDRDSGRIWRIAYVGVAADKDLATTQPLLIDTNQLLSELTSTNATRRRLAMDIAVGRAEFTSEAAFNILRDSKVAEQLRRSCLEVLFRRGQFALTHAEPLAVDTLQQHLLVRQLSLAVDLPTAQRTQFAALMRDQFPYSIPHANLAGCRLLGSVRKGVDIPLLARFARDSNDPALVHTARIAMKNILGDDEQLKVAISIVNDPTLERIVAEVLPAVDSELSADTLLNFISTHGDASKKLIEAASNLATKHASDRLIQRLLGILKQTHANDVVAQVQAVGRLCTAYLSNHRELSSQLRLFGAELQMQLVDELVTRQAEHGLSLNWSDADGADWKLEKRMSDGGASIPLRSSFTRGESYTGALSSDAFACPAELRFVIAGHNGHPSKPTSKLNKIELQVADSGLVLESAFPPRSDVAASVAWKLDQPAGKPVRVVVTDGDAGSAYAWLAVGKFSLDSLNPSTDQDFLSSFIESLRQGFAALDPATMARLQLNPRGRAELMAASLQGQGASTASLLVTWAVKLGRSELVNETLLSAHAVSDLSELAKQLARTATSSKQRQLAADLLHSSGGCELLEQLLREGLLSASSLNSTEVLWPQGLSQQTRQYLQSQFDLAAETSSSVGATAERVARLNWSAGDRVQGQQLYQQHCAACHQLHGVGAVVGPQLDGAVVRGAERLCEDILEPNLNVDTAFRVSAILLDDDTVLNGLVREEPNGMVVITGQDGTAKQFPLQRIQQRRDMTQSLMPANFAELLSDQQLVSLMTFLVAGERGAE